MNPRYLNSPPLWSCFQTRGCWVLAAHAAAAAGGGGGGGGAAVATAESTGLAALTAAVHVAHLLLQLCLALSACVC